MTRSLERVVALLLDAMARTRCAGEEIDHLDHALQTAHMALAAASDEALVAAAVLHDVGRLPAVARRHPGVSHEVAGSRWCRHRLPGRTAWLVGVHDRSRWLLRPPGSGAADGGPPAAVIARRILGHRWAADAVTLRMWDENARRPGGPRADRDEIERLLRTLWNR